MEPIKFRLPAYLLLAILLCACGKGNRSTPTASSGATAANQTNSLAPTLQVVDQEIKAGKFDDAAAKLMGLRAAGYQFNNREGAEFRRAMNDAYSQAVEAAAKGDPRGKVAMEMLRASGNR